ncbi:ABC transporter permease [Micromonospora aurantiaca]|uniref:ABC transporter permease n=1 Tax=Micromonospora aurantiaca (nom. illeg.) TaxID=47850 RepID=A0A1C6SAA2_9ACTN|nr:MULTISPECIES: ABC transporter permease [Micromonospora]ADL46628.1 binding-protein-dependent transport systems inner membrane component [Micromonospora aurantiaca ATCC 27029]AXH92599.1 ABC transporter permease [Micromonospora aurantiaca]KAB1111160.1 ABC transporter permease [Micromonospora aurantiaca]MBC9003876.1 ABC transporter permease [Micromonospora aurantiaca]OHX02358.1 peptide ABC transporter permease [Micromonospora sp. WMMB235]
MRFLLQRVAFYLFTAWAAITLNFFIPRMVPGDPVQSLISRNQGRISADAIASLRVLFGLDSDRSLWEQYVAYWGQLLHGDLGLSFTFFPAPVSQVIGDSLPWTVGLVGVTTIVSFLLGTALGVGAGWRRGSWIDGLLPATTFLSSIPYFWLGLVAIALFAGPGSFFPSSGGYEPGLVPAFDAYFVPSAIQHSILPAATILVSSMSGWILSMRNMMVTVASEDYITVAHAKGLSERRVALSYAARNALLPNVSGFALSLGFIVGGTLLVEIVFSYPGLGFQLFQAVGAKDYPLMQGIFLIITISVLVANLLADVAYLLLDPRTRKS